MAMIKEKHYEDSIGILWSATGLVTKSATGTQAMAVAGDDGHKTLEAGTLFETDDLLGVVFQDYDMTEREDYPIAVVVAGHIRADRIADEAKAKATEFAKQGLFIHGDIAVEKASEEPTSEEAASEEPASEPTE